MCPQEYIFNVNGLEIRAKYRHETVRDIFLPLLRRWTSLFRQREQRIVVFLSAPPGTGKSTLGLFLEELSRDDPELTEIQTLGLDGFHYHSEYIKTHTVDVNGTAVPMAKVKGCPESYDIAKLKEKLRRLREGDVLWPIYDRGIHDVLEDRINVDKNIILLEGNWLLYNEGPWAELINSCDDSIFISADSNILRQRLIDRKIKGGLSPAEAEEFYKNSDLKNIEKLMAHHHTAATELLMTSDGDFERDLPKD